MHGWRRDLFGERAIGLKTGRTALAISGRRVVAVDLP
jgi:ribonuclease D